MQLLNVDRARLTVRSLPPSAVAVTLLASVPAVATVAFGGSDLAGAAVAAALLGGSLAGFAADDPAGALLEPSPTTLLARRLHHVVALLAYATVLGLVVALLVSVAHDGPPISLLERVREATAAGGLAVAAAAWLARSTGERRPGSFGLLAGLLGPLFVSALAFRVQGLPAVSLSQDASRWWWVAGVGWTAALWWSRDPAARPAAFLARAR